MYHTKFLTILLLITSVVIATATTSIVDHQFASAKYCNPSGCKGDKGYYTVNGHHHCYEGTKGCVESGYHKGS